MASYLDFNSPLEERVADLVSRMTLEEKISQMLHDAPAVERLGIPAYNWWNECLHGVARAGTATVFPQAIGLAAAWNVDLMHRIAVAISDEARAKHHEALRQGQHGIYQGLTYWSPNINIFRDPRWGRGQETYGEDPYLTTRMGVAFVSGLQGDDPDYLKLVATPKHYAVHSGPEHARHHFDAVVNERDLRETYLPAFAACVQEAGAASVMGAYNRTNGEPCCASHRLLQEILREEWGFDGYVVSDCGAIGDIYRHHQVVETRAEAAALAVKMGCELNCGGTYEALLEAVAQGLIEETVIDEAVKRLFTARFRLGMFDPPEKVAYSQIPLSVVASTEHRQLALQAARESLVLLKNEADLLPLRDNLKRIAVIGPNADDALVLLGNYHGDPLQSVTPLSGIRSRVSAKTEVLYAPGCGIIGNRDDDACATAIAYAKKADAVIFVGGLSQLIEGEEGQEEGIESGGHSLGDRTRLDLPAAQSDLLRELEMTGTPVVLVLLNGGPVSLPWAAKNIPAILEAWYPGEAGGTAVAEALFGDINPAGRLPITIPKSVDDLPPFDDYGMAGRTYRFADKEPLYPFGFGLSYTEFAYSDLRLNQSTINLEEPLIVEIAVQNVGKRPGDEVVQVYISDVAASVPVPVRQLQGFQRIHLQPGEKQIITFTIHPSQLALIDDAGQRVVEPGAFEISVGGRQPVLADYIEAGTAVCLDKFVVIGEAKPVAS